MCLCLFKTLIDLNKKRSVHVVKYSILVINNAISTRGMAYSLLWRIIQPKSCQFSGQFRIYHFSALLGFIKRNPRCAV
jgi:hypothetical protein